MPTPVVVKIGPEGLAGSAPPRARVDAFGLEQNTLPTPPSLERAIDVGAHKVIFMDSLFWAATVA